VFYRDGRSATLEVESLIGKGWFQFPKNTEVLAELIELTTGPKDLILDFFAGSGSTAHAVLEINASNGSDRRFIAVQLPESTGRDGFATIADICKERIRQAGKKIRDKSRLLNQNLDIGFRVLKVDTSTMKDVYYAPDGVKQGDLLDQVENIREDRTPEDLLFQVLLDWGVDLSLPISQEAIDGKTVFFVDQNALAACFDTGVTEELVKKLAARKPLRAVFRDAGFSSDSVKINVEQIFKLVSPGTEVKAI
jgi:adenine-specific DNA-methyltransferase